MANKIQHKRSSTGGATPTTGQLDFGELGINTADGKIFIKRNHGTPEIFEHGSDKVTGNTKITVGTTAPASPATGDLWVDTN